LLAEGGLAAVLVTSSSTVDSLCRLLGADAARLLDRICLASIGPVTSRTALGHGLRVDVTAEVSTLEGLVDALQQHLAEQPERRDGAQKK
jgi:uroporphyrinogen III methyltransferase/synthase